MRVEGKPIQAVTVARLIEYLQSCPQNLPVAFCLYSEQQLLQLEQVAFGKSGTICKSISRKWDAGQVESAMLFCAGGNICVARWSVCNNYSIVYRTPVPTKTLPPVAGIPPEAPFEGGGVNPQPDAPPAGPELVGFVPPPSSDSPGYPVWVPYPVPSGGGFYPSPPTVGPTINPVGVIPEPETWALFAAGLLLMVWQGMRRRA
jgi:hypothetical protein